MRGAAYAADSAGRLRKCSSASGFAAVPAGADPASVIYVDNKDVGAFMRKRVFGPGKTLDWDALAKHATGESLNAKAFAADFKSR